MADESTLDDSMADESMADESMVPAPAWPMISEKKSRIACNTELPCSSSSSASSSSVSSSFPVEEQYLNIRNSNEHENFHVYIFSSWRVTCALSGYINPFTSCVIDRYQYKQCIMIETETETNMKICMY